MKTSHNIEKLFIEHIKDIGGTPGGFLGVFDPKLIEEGDPKKLGREIQRGADILENGIKYIDFQPWEYEKGKTGSRLVNAINVYREMGVEIEQLTEKEPNEYHLYVIAILIDIVSSLINHLEAHMSETHD